MNKLNKFFNYTIAFLLISYATYFVLHKNSFFSVEQKIHQTDLSSVDVDKVVNRYLKETTDQIAKERYKSKKIIDQALQQPVHLSKKPNPSESEISSELQIHKNQPEFKSPSEVITSQVIDQKNLVKMDESEKKEYARQFIENARKGGYQIILSDDLKVISVTPLRTPSNNDIDSVEILPSN